MSDNNTSSTKPATGTRGVKGALPSGKSKVRGISTNPATNALIADIAVLGATTLFQKGMERMLKGPPPAEPEKTANAAKTAGNAKPSRSARIRGFVTTKAANTATRSVPGLLLVSGGLLAKAIFDRGRNRRNARRAAKMLTAGKDAG